MTEKDAAKFGIEDKAGVLVSRVIDKLPAQATGLRKEDVVLAVGSQPAVAKTIRDLENTSSDKPVTLTILRSGAKREITIKPLK